MKAVDFFLIAMAMLFGASMFYAIHSGLQNIAYSAYRIGCASTGASLEVVEQCKSQVRSKVGI